MDTSTPTDTQEPSKDTPSVEQSTTEIKEVQPAPPTLLPKPQNSAITLVLQWLTYASWLWFSVAILWLSATVIGYFVEGSNGVDTVEVIAYPIAAVIVLLLVSSSIDFFYARREPEHKEGFGTVIMVIHAVIFALCGIGTLITIVFTLINLLIQGGTTNSSGKTSLVILLTSLVGLLVYIALIARTTLVAKIRRVSLVVSAVMVALGIGFAIAAFAGPVTHAIVTKQDKELEAVLPDVSYALNDYVTSKGNLPTSLSELDFSNTYYARSADDVKAVIQKGLIKYTPNTKKPTSDGDVYGYPLSKDLASDKSISSAQSYYTTHYYRLCVTWQAEKKGDGSYIEPQAADDISSGSTSSSGASASYSSSYLTTITHKKGEQCYELSATSYSTV